MSCFAQPSSVICYCCSYTETRFDASLLLLSFDCLAEKNLAALSNILKGLPENVCLAFVGDGPARKDLERQFEGQKVVFTVSLGNSKDLVQSQHASLLWILE